MSACSKTYVARICCGGAMLVLVALTTNGCGYPEVSPKTYQYAKALVNICGRQATEKLESLESQIAVSFESGEITLRESKWLGEIVDDAKSGDWLSADEAARAIMKDQLK